jgi:hypothetical protein
VCATIEGLRDNITRSVALIDGFRPKRDQAQKSLADERARADAGDADRHLADARALAAEADRRSAQSRADAAIARADHERDRADAERTQADALKGVLEATEQGDRPTSGAEALRQADTKPGRRGGTGRVSGPRGGARKGEVQSPFPNPISTSIVGSDPWASTAERHEALPPEPRLECAPCPTRRPRPSGI